MINLEKIPWNPDSESITVSTDSVAGSNERVNVLCGSLIKMATRH